MTHKAGGDALDPELGTWWSYVRSYDSQTLLGAYWVLYPGSPAARATAFLAQLDAKCPGWRDRDAFILQADCEEWNGDPDTKPGKADISAFCNALVSATGGKYRPIVYASQGQYQDSLTGVGFPLWNARYPYSVAESFTSAYARAGGDNGKGWTSYSGQTPAIWQYTSNATIGGQSSSDANAFRGTIDQLKTLLTPGAVMTAPTAAENASAVWGASFGPATARETAGDRLGHVDATIDDLVAKVDALSAGTATVDVDALAGAIVNGLLESGITLNVTVAPPSAPPSA